LRIASKRSRDEPMPKLLIAVALLLAAAGTAAAGGTNVLHPFYMAIERGTGKCVMMRRTPNPSKCQLMGTYTKSLSV